LRKERELSNFDGKEIKLLVNIDLGLKNIDFGINEFYLLRVLLGCYLSFPLPMR
jgi:hypothetical protein